MPNRLATETSPYLRQHAGNPVDWYPWSPEALERAKAENKPILLSIGYAACHWCHVMAHESFEDDATAALMNERFVSIKVDREERPDLDSIYMQAVQAMTGHGGWPMTVFLTPDGAPFYGGTYYPREDRHGIPSFKRILAAVSEAYRAKPAEVAATVEALRDLYVATQPVAGEPISATLLDDAYRFMSRAYDEEYGGFGGAPKFPQTMSLEFLLTHWARRGIENALAIVEQSFLRMARGGIYDQIGGGFARYAVDRVWLVPHFEKMLYDNALLIRLGAHLWQATKNAEVKRVVGETIRWVEREMRSPEGGFYSSLDADSEGHEGKFYVWDVAELDAILGPEAPLLRAYWGVTPAGNFEGRNILSVADVDHRTLARQFSIEVEQLELIVERAKAKLYEVRSTRVWPGRDDKILASWNGLMVRALAEAARAFGDDEYGALAIEGATFLFDRLVRDGRVLRSYSGGRARIAGYLEDHAARRSGGARRVRADLRRPLARARPRPRCIDDALVLGRFRGRVLRHGVGSRNAHHAPARRVRQRDAVGHVAGRRAALASGRPVRRSRSARPRDEDRQLARSSRGAVSVGVRAHARLRGHARERSRRAGDRRRPGERSVSRAGAHCRGPVRTVVGGRRRRIERRRRGHPAARS